MNLHLQKLLSMHLGDLLIPFKLKGTDLQIHNSDESQNRAIAVIFICNHCSYVRAYANRLKIIFQKYGDKVSFYFINSNDARQFPEDSFEHMQKMAEHLGVGGQYLHDESQEVAHAYHAERTPEVFLFSKQAQLIYHGGIDDNWEKPEEVSIHYLEAAIEAILENEEVMVKETQPKGCTIKWKK